MSKRYASRSSTTYYCTKEGLVDLPPMVRCTLPELEQLKTRIFDSALKPEELTELRGERQDATTTAGGKEECCDMMVEDASENPCMGEEDIMVEYSPDHVMARVTLSTTQEEETRSIDHGTEDDDASASDDESADATTDEAFEGDIPSDHDLEANAADEEEVADEMEEQV